MTFTLLVSGFESAALTLRLKVLTGGASLSMEYGNRLLLKEETLFLRTAKLVCSG